MRGELRGQKDKDLKLNADDENVVVQAQGKDQEKDEGVSLEKQQEILLINKMAAGGKLPPKNQSMFLQKKLQQRKFFDSGDYAMNQNKEKKTLPHPPPPTITPPTAQQQQHQQKSPTITHHNVVQPQEEDADQMAEEQCSQALPTLRAPMTSLLSVGGASIDAGDSDEEGQLQIPRPDTVPQRKASILHPSVHSKLSPAPHIHHEHSDESITGAPQ